jgi:dihydrofolate reductase
MMRNSMRKIISAMRMSVDWYIEDPEGRQDWVDSWEDEYELLDQVDTCVLGSVMYPGYEQYWTSALDPNRKLPYSDKLPTAKEVEYAQWASKTPHIVVSRKPMQVSWKNSRVISDLGEIRNLKQKPGGDIHVVGGAKLVSSMINLGLIDEIWLMINPVLLGGGKLLFEGVNKRHYLKFVSSEERAPGKVYVKYKTKHDEEIR